MNTSLKHLLSIVFAFGLCLAFAPADTFAQNSPAQFSPLAPEDLPKVSLEDLAIATSYLEEAQQAFMASPAITSTTKVVVKTGDQTRELVVNSKFGPNGQAFVEAPDSLVVAKDGWLNIVNYNIYDRYIRVQMSGTIPQEFDSIYSDKYAAGFEVLMRAGEPVPVWLEAIMMRSIGVPSIISLEEITDDSGRKLKQIGLAGRMGRGVIDYDPESKKILHASSSMYPIEVQGDQQADDFTWVMNMNINATLMDALPEPIVFDPGKRMAVATRKQVDPVTRNAVVVGSPAPSLTASRLDGSEVDIANLKGKVVLLDFWATWCAPCKKGLPKLDELYQEYGANDGEVMVYAVSVMETPSKAEDKIKKVSEFWKKQDYAVPTLVCTDAEIVKNWGIKSIPMIVILDKQGNVAKVLKGYHSNMKERLQAKINSLESSE